MSAAISRGCSLRRERQLEGIASAEVRGVYKGRKASNRCREDQEDEGRRRGAVCDCRDVEDRSSVSLSRTRGVSRLFPAPRRGGKNPLESMLILGKAPHKADR